MHINSCILATSANVTSQRIAGAKKLNQQSVFAYGLFGIIFGGTVPHYFYQTVERLFSHDLRFRKFFLFLAERLTFAPFYQLLSLYFLSIFEVSFRGFTLWDTPEHLSFIFRAIHMPQHWKIWKSFTGPFYTPTGSTSPYWSFWT